MTTQLSTRNDRKRPVRLAYVVSHPIQYQAPLLRRIAEEPDIDLTVFFCSDFSVRGYQDQGFGDTVKWDVPLLNGYKSEFLPSIRPEKQIGAVFPFCYDIPNRLRGADGERRFDALWLHGYASLNSIYAMLAAKVLGIPVLLRAESWLAERPRGRVKLVGKKLFFGLLQRLVAAVLPIGTANSQYWSHYFGHSIPQFLVPYAVDNHYFQSRSRAAESGRAALRTELDLDANRPVILFAGKLQTRKHCDHLLSAYARLAEGGSDPHPYLVIVGSGEERQALEAQAAATGFKSIRFCGFRNQSELPRFFDLASVFVLPSRSEAWGLIVNEVMNAARAIIVSDDVGCQPDLVRNGVEGCVYPVGDVAGLEAALRKVLRDPGEAAAMGLRALERVNVWSFEEDVQGLQRALAHVTHQR